MMMTPTMLPAKTADENVAVYLQLVTGIGTATIVGTPAFTSDPAGLVFTGAGTIDGAQTVAVFASGGSEGTTYTVSALCLLSNGETVEPCVALPVVSPHAETRTRRCVTL